MKVTRNTTNRIRNFLDNFIPPFLRDCKWLFYLPYKFLFGSQSELFFQFREVFIDMTETEIETVYKAINDLLIHSRTDLNDKCICKILQDCIGPEVLDVACGSGELSIALSQNCRVTAVDIVKPGIVGITNIQCVQGNLENMPFPNNSFDTVVSTHTLEHITDIFRAVKELRRLASKKLIIVIPRERPYRFGFNLHVHFFPYAYSLYNLFGKKKMPHYWK